MPRWVKLGEHTEEKLLEMRVWKCEADLEIAKMGESSERVK